MYGPLVLGNTGDDIVMRQRPCGWNPGILYPGVPIRWGEGDVVNAVLREECFLDSPATSYAVSVSKGAIKRVTAA